MKRTCLSLLGMGLAAGVGLAACSSSTTSPTSEYAGPSFDVVGGAISYEPQLDSLIFEASVAGDVASVAPTPAGKLDGAPVLGYVFLTNLAPTTVGFPDDGGTLALAVTSHPDFDDTPLWDEDNNEAYDDDGRVYHTHWVVLVEDATAPAGLAVKQAMPAQKAALPPTAPMAMYLDSPGFAVLERGSKLQVIVPFDRVRRHADFTADIVTAYMQVDASGEMPKLAVHEVLGELAGDMPLSVRGKGEATAAAFPVATAGEGNTGATGTFDIEAAEVSYVQDLDLLVFSMSTAANVATRIPTPAGGLDGAPVLGYVFPTSLAPAVAGFGSKQGTLALAVTSHPDFDDTPLWDENLNGTYGDDGGAYHVHWAVLVADSGSTAGLSVPPAPEGATLPPTAPMPMYLDSPGFHAFASGKRLRVLVPSSRIDGSSDFHFDGVTARMQVDASEPMATLRVQEVFEVLSGDLSLPYAVTMKSLEALDD